MCASEEFDGGRLRPNGLSGGSKLMVLNLIKLFNTKFKFSAFRLEISVVSRCWIWDKISGEMFVNRVLQVGHLLIRIWDIHLV